jgi:hypothetical protein
MVGHSLRRFLSEPASVQERIVYPTTNEEKKVRKFGTLLSISPDCGKLGISPYAVPASDGLDRDLQRTIEAIQALQQGQ